MKILKIFFISLFLFSCTNKIPEDAFYDLDVSYKEKLFYGQPLVGNLEIKDVSANGLLSGQAIVFVDENNIYSSYKYAYWKQSPELMLKNKLEDFLLKSATVEEIIDSKNGKTADYELFAQIENFEQKKNEIGQVFGYVKIKFSVFDKNKKKIILLDRYESKKELPAENIDMFVSAVGNDIEEILNNLIEDLRGRLS
jgi:ABC-type uncharacterized transport system auxiliary subunit